jgi:hypothetical protein
MGGFVADKIPKNAAGKKKGALIGQKNLPNKSAREVD